MTKKYAVTCAIKFEPLLPEVCLKFRIAGFFPIKPVGVRIIANSSFFSASVIPRRFSKSGLLLSKRTFAIASEMGKR